MFRAFLTLVLVFSLIGCVSHDPGTGTTDMQSGSSVGKPKKKGGKSPGGMLGVVVTEMKSDNVSPHIMKKYRPQIIEAKKAGDAKKARQLVIQAIEEAYGITMWQKVSYKSSDGLVIPAFLSLPAGGKQVPGIVMVHGHTHGSSTTYVQHSFLLAKEGYACLAVDYRSSVGHGDYLKNADDPSPGGKEFDDVIAGINYLKKHPQVAPNRVALMGGSRGAYISANVGVRVPVPAMVLYYGGFNANSMSVVAVDKQKTEEARLKKEQQIDDTIAYYGGERGFERVLYERSPINFVGKIQGPVLLIHGKKDAVVPYSESIDFADALKRANKKVELKIYEHGPHGFVFNTNSEAKDAYDRTLSFLNKNL